MLIVMMWWFGLQVLQDNGGKLFVFRLLVITPTSYAIYHPRTSLEKLWED